MDGTVLPDWLCVATAFASGRFFYKSVGFALLQSSVSGFAFRFGFFEKVFLLNPIKILNLVAKRQKT